ncbi:hypothetical protein CEUSTIGMA_g5032.t1 [Chlamydomonas eustigma]|uniref:MATH domain-containing protein n=1 Tax=Chlamydomonas eustigma TaxID=1157962 RepID=A0A250X3E0_9CHLO|nr:hypothetical protein CEUSTIGMA_g5032.t1 [Chlamydomonas eustigma]|eukprot:GAX77588.1 hypothetical protein CEUSTIGMA_g5032.t1 [Chlamydomonas eustigma]
MTKTYKFEIIVEEGSKGPHLHIPQSKSSKHRRPQVAVTKGPASEEVLDESLRASDEDKITSKRKQNNSKSLASALSLESEEESQEIDSSDSDTDECYQPLGLEPWRYPVYSPSASFRQVDVVSGSHQYTISGFPLARSMGCGTRLCSDFFEVCGQLFRLEVYPGGFTADCSPFVSTFLTTPGAMHPNQVMYEIAILDQSGKDRHIIEKRDAHTCSCETGGRGCRGWCCHHARQGPMMTHSRGIIAAVPKFVKAGFLIKYRHRYMPCDMLVFRATIQVLQGWSSAPKVHTQAGYGYTPSHQHTMPSLSGIAAAPSYQQSPLYPVQQQQQYTYQTGSEGCTCHECQQQQQQHGPYGSQHATYSYLPQSSLPGAELSSPTPQTSYSVPYSAQQQQQLSPPRVSSSALLYAPLGPAMPAHLLPLPNLPSQQQQQPAWSYAPAASGVNPSGNYQVGPYMSPNTAPPGLPNLSTYTQPMGSDAFPQGRTPYLMYMSSPNS